MYKGFLGDKYDGTPESTSTDPQSYFPPTNGPLNTPPTNAPPIAPPSASNVDVVDTNSKDTERKGGDGNTQVMEFFDSIKKCRESRPAHPNTQQISKCRVNDSSSDSDEEVQIGECCRRQRRNISIFYSVALPAFMRVGELFCFCESRNRS